MSRSLEPIPNSFQVPNFLVDKSSPHLSGPQAKILMVLCRKTFGWHKREDVISFGQFRDEAGVSRSSAIEALRVFMDAGLAIKAKQRACKHQRLELELGRGCGQGSGSGRRPRQNPRPTSTRAWPPKRTSLKRRTSTAAAY